MMSSNCNKGNTFYSRLTLYYHRTKQQYLSESRFDSFVCLSNSSTLQFATFVCTCALNYAAKIKALILDRRSPPSYVWLLRLWSRLAPSVVDEGRVLLRLGFANHQHLLRASMTKEYLRLSRKAIPDDRGVPHPCLSSNQPRRLRQSRHSRIFAPQWTLLY